MKKSEKVVVVGQIISVVPERYSARRIDDIYFRQDGTLSSDEWSKKLDEMQNMAGKKVRITIEEIEEEDK